MFPLTDYFALFLIIAIGIGIGRIKFRGISLDLSAVIFVALVFGHYGVALPKVFQTIGLIFFLYAVGIQAGPGFFNAFKQKGPHFVLLTVTLIGTGLLTTLIAMFIFNIDRNMAVGLFTGAMTSTPGLAAAVEVAKKPELASIGYGIAYPFGVVGMILFVHIIPRIMRIRLKTEEMRYVAEFKTQNPELVHQHFVVANANIVGKTIEELEIRSLTGATITRIRHDGVTSVPTQKSVLEKGDLVRGVGTQAALNKIKLLIGPSTTQDIPLPKNAEVKWFVVTNKHIVGKTLGQVNLVETYAATVARIRRSGVDFVPSLGSTLRYGDQLLIICAGSADCLARLLGNEDKKLMQTDFLPIAIGVMLGVLVGSIPIPFFGGVTFNLGLTGGVIIVALLLSRVGKIGPVVWNISGPASQLLRQLGLLMFLAAVGTHAGKDLVATAQVYGSKLFFVGMAITLIPLFVTVMVAWFTYKLNFLTILGLVTGARTCSAGLAVVDAITESSAHSVAYAAVYPFAIVIMVICAQLLCLV